MLLIDSLYIHQSGGKILLEFFLSMLNRQGQPFLVLLDDRMDLETMTSLPNADVRRMQASEKERKAFYRTIPSNITAIFCFANVPPPVAIQKTSVYIYFHNILITSGFFESKSYSVKNKLLFLLKRFYIILKNKPSYKWVVQTGLVKSSVIEKLHVKENNVLILPFFDLQRFEELSRERKPQVGSARFLYVADGVNQKNHMILLDAFDRLFERGINPGLALTVPCRFTLINERVRQLMGKGVQVTNFGNLSFDRLLELYSGSEYLVFPSLAESFGLPLLEAVSAGCKVVASELPYVHAVIEPTDTFNPWDADSIAEAISRCVGTNDTPSSQITVTNEIFNLIKMLTGNG